MDCYLLDYDNVSHHTRGHIGPPVCFNNNNVFLYSTLSWHVDSSKCFTNDRR